MCQRPTRERPTSTRTWWQTVEELFEQLLAIPESQRADLLDRQQIAPELRREVEELLAADQSAGLFLERSAVAEVERALVPRPISLTPGHQIGPYRLIRELGRGGMGTVFLGERADGQFEQRVAIKWIHHGGARNLLDSGFRRERQILSDLVHPNIARLLDGGVSEEGHPYLVMEYIEGRPLDRYCDEERATIERRLELFRQVCRAVQHAHRNLVVHRDIKPSNILVTEDGIPKLLDFGTAKLLEPFGASDSASPPTLALPFFTPEYASPEQVQGDPITTASDVYSMGILLYELLSGCRPYEVPRGRPKEWLRVVGEVVPERLSARVRRETPPRAATSDPALEVRRCRNREQWTRQLRGDLETIVSRALQKDPESRYSSAEELGEDITRHLHSLPIRARAPSLGYQLSRLVQRHVGAAIAGALLLVTLIGGLGATLWQARRATDALRRAETEAATSARISDFLLEVFAASDPMAGGGRQPTARQVLDQGARRIRLGLRQEPDVRAAVMDAMGQAYAHLGLYEEAEPLLREALEVRRALGEEGAENVNESLDHLGETLSYRGDFDAAGELFREAYDRRRQRWGEEHPAVARSLIRLAGIEVSHSRLGAGRDLYEKALALQLRSLGEIHSDVAETRVLLANLVRQIGDLARAEAEVRQAIEIRRRLQIYDHPDTADALGILGLVLTDLQEIDEATEAHRASLAMSRRWFGNDHFRVALATNDIAVLDATRGDYAAALEGYRAAFEIFRRVYGPRHHFTAIGQRNVASALLALGEAEQARAPAEEALALHLELLGEQHRYTVMAMDTAGEALAQLGELESAEEHLTRSLRIKNRIFGPRHYQIAISHLALAELYLRQKRPRAALPLLVSAGDLFRTAANPTKGERKRWERLSAEVRAALPVNESGAAQLASCLEGAGTAAPDPVCRARIESELVRLGL